MVALPFIHVLNDRAYPRLKDAVVGEDVYPVLYNQVMKDMRIMYQICRLVHADLSEFNLLYSKSGVTLILGMMIRGCM
jgi:RIO kinase 1